MTQPINLNKVRKAKARIAAKKQADTNSAKFGQTKAQRELTAAREAHAAEKLTQLKCDDD